MEAEDKFAENTEERLELENELYEETMAKFPQLRSFSKQELLNQLKRTNNKKVENNEEDMPMRKIFIDHVISNDTKFTDAEVRDHVYTVVAAGSETTALQTAHTSKTEIRKRNSFYGS